MGDDRPGVELAGAEEPTHLVPGLVHLAAGHAIEREALEDHIARKVDLGGSAGRSQQVHPPAQAGGRERLRVAAGMTAHLADQVHAVPPGQLPDPGEHVVAAGLRVTCAPMARASSSRMGLKSLAITSDAPAARATPTAKQPIGPQPSTSTVLPGTRASSTVWTALPMRVHDGADLGGNPVEPHDVGGGHGDVVGEGAVPIHPDDLGALAEVRRSQSALEAVAAHDVALRGDQVTHGEKPGRLGLAAELHDLSGELMADRPPAA